jgi:hypothetical protein
MLRKFWKRISRRPAQSGLRGRSGSRLRLEPLESRWLLAGNVTITSVTVPQAVEGLLSSPALSANFTDAVDISANQLTATVDYGDGTPLSTATIAKVGTNQYTVTDTHTFPEESGSVVPPFDFTVTLHVFETASPTVNTDTATSQAPVVDAPLSAGNPVTAGTPQQFTGGNQNNAAAAALTNFETAIGGSNNGAAAPPTPLTTGFRDINWDGVKLDGTDFGGGPNTIVIDAGKTVGIPLNRFQERGVFFGAIYAVSGPASATDPSTFADVNPNVAGLLPAFSPKNTFAMFNDNGIDFKFVLPSAHTTELVSAASRGFGAIFENVTIPNTTSIEYFNGSTSLGKFFAPVGPKGQSVFLGELFNNPIVTNVTLTLGTDVIFKFDGTTFSSSGVVDDGTTHNLVSVDDWVYPEPVAIANGFPINSGPAGTTNAATGVTATEGAAFTGVVASFSDSDPNGNAKDFTAVINWGDGHQSNGSITKNAAGGFDVSGTNTYATTGLFPINVDVQDFGGSVVSINDTAKVGTRILAVTGVPITVAQGVVANNVQVATFTDAGGAQAISNYTATIDWGDGTPPSSGGIALSGTTFAVTASHTFAAPGKFTVHVTVTDTGGSSGSGTTSATVGSVNERFVAAVFKDLLHRLVDPTGLAFWTSQLAANASTTQVVQGIESSVEYRTDVVEALYMQFLHRAADPNGLATFVALLSNGGTDEQVAAAILGSQEYFQLHGNTNTSFLTGLYQDTLNRAPDATGLAAFTQQLTSSTSPSQVAAEILSSPEYQQELVQNLYKAHLHRAADSGGLATFSGALQGGASDEAVIAALLGSTEFLQSV